MPLRTTTPRLRVESLEDRVTPAVTAALNGAGTLTVTLDAANDTATVTGTGAGTDIDVSGTGLATQSFTAVNAVIVVDNGGNAGHFQRLDRDGQYANADHQSVVSDA